MATTITDVLNTWNNIGVFSYVIPFLLIFAVVFAILKKTKILSDKDEENNGILAIIAVAIGLLALQFDMVSNFFAVIFPRFGVGLSIFLVAIIFIGFFIPLGGNEERGSWIGYVIGIGVIIWALSAWDDWTGDIGFGGWFSENFWALVVIGIIIAVIAITIKPPKSKTP
jgi:hypothetical protein